MKTPPTAEQQRRTRISRRSKGKGRAGEHQWAGHLRRHGWTAERRLLSGSHTRSGAGDVKVFAYGNWPVHAWEVKRKKLIPHWLRDWARYPEILGMAFRSDSRGTGARSTGDAQWFVVLRSEQCLRWMTRLRKEPYA